MNGWQCSRIEHTGRPPHQARDPEAPPVKVDGCFIVDDPIAVVEEWEG